MFPKTQRIKQQLPIEKLNRSKHSVRTEHLQFKVLESNKFRVMIVVGKKQFKMAHERVRMKRRILTLLRTESSEEKFNNHSIQVRIAKKEILHYNYAQLRAEVLDGLRKLSQILTTMAK